MRRTMMVGGLVVVALVVVFGVWRVVRSGPVSPGVLGADRGAESLPPGTQLRGAGTSLPGTTDRTQMAASSTAVRSHSDGRRRAFDRVRADGVRQRAFAVSAPAGAKATASASGSATTSASAPQPKKPDREALTTEEKARRRQYIQDAVREQYFPVVRSCYQELLGRKPSSAGKIVMSFAIVSDGEDGVVDRVEVGEGTTMDDPEFTLCMRESMYSTIFEPPPPGAAETTIEYPIELSPGP